MKKFLLIVLALALLVSSVAVADTKIDPTKDRKVKVQDKAVNPVIEGESPTTGRKLSEIEVPAGAGGLAAGSRYMPMLVQIDNAGGGVGHRAPWGFDYVDIMYESPLYLLSKSKNGVETRISFLFSDVLPDAVGPVRSARVGHAWLREEWDCGFVFYGQQSGEKASVLAVFNDTGASKKNVLFSGIAGSNAPWKKYYSVRNKLAAPHNKSANIAGMVELIPQDHIAPNHTFLFTDEPAQGKPATRIDLHWNDPEYDSYLRYDAANDVYLRYMGPEKKLTPYVDYDTQNQIGFSNVIVQHTVTEWPRVDSPITKVVGEGNADFFMNGVRVAGYWKRPDMAARTVYYTLDGEELKLQRGKTLIILLPLENFVTYGAD